MKPFLTFSLLFSVCVLFVVFGISANSQQVSTSSQTGSYLLGTTGSIGGSLLAIGATASGTASISGAQPGMPCIAGASDGTNMAALGADVNCTVTSSNTATVNLIAIVSLTPASKTYNVRVIP